MFKKLVSFLIPMLMISTLIGQSIFDVYRDSTQLEVLNEALPTKIEEDTQVGDEDELENPFDVSHVPLRKNTITEQSNTKRYITATQSTSKNHQLGTIIPMLIILLTSLLLGIVTFNYRNLFSDLRLSIMNLNYMNSLRKKLSGITPYIGILYLIFILNVGLFLLLIFNSKIPMSGEKALLFLCISVMIMYLLKHIVLRLFGWIFDLENESGSYSYTIGLVNVSIGIIFIPINLMLAFGPVELFKAVVGFALLMVLALLGFRFFRGIVISSKYVVSRTLQFFLYFCTLEIAPVLVIMYCISNFS